MSRLTKNDPYTQAEWGHFDGLELYLNLLELLPDHVMLAVAARDLNLADAKTCVCGWAVREALACATNQEADNVLLDDPEELPRSVRAALKKLRRNNSIGYLDDIDDDAPPYYQVPSLCAVLFGGTAEAWSQLFSGVVEMEAPVIERAMMLRLLEIET